MIKDFLFKTKDGKYVYGEKPSWPLYLALALQVLRRLAPNEDIDIILGSAIPAILLYWAYLEIVHGTTSFKRITGLLIGFIALVALVNSVST